MPGERIERPVTTPAVPARSPAPTRGRCRLPSSRQLPLPSYASGEQGGGGSFEVEEGAARAGLTLEASEATEGLKQCETQDGSKRACSSRESA
jgi:hypothetical protein